MEANAIIFDKDGTLIDFDAFWVTVSVNALNDVLDQLGRRDIPLSEILESFGVHDGVTDINGVLCKGTYAQMGHIVQGILAKYGCAMPCDTVIALVSDACKKHAHTGIIRPTCPDLADVLRRLKQRNKKLAVVTTDNQEITRRCLKTLGIEDLFDGIYTDDGKTPPKPDPYCAMDFARLTGTPMDRLVMVGDTLTDMKFARNAGITAVGLAKTPRNRAILEPHADVVLSTIAQLADRID